jgi:probable phosphoglycerate mutase
LIRHGQAFANVEPIIAGMKGDAGLTPLGVQQAERLRDRLAASGEIKPDVFLASSLPRARQTAEILAPAFGMSPTLDDELHELRPGDEADGLSVAEFKARFGWVDQIAEPLRPVAPGGESWTRFVVRVGEALERITRAHGGKTIVAVCHGGVIDSAFLYFFGMSTFAFAPISFDTANTSLTCWRREPARGRMRWRLAFYNDATHLRGLETGERMDWATITSAASVERDHPAVPLATEDDAPA